MLTSKLSAEHMEWLESRGLDVSLALEYGFKTVGGHIAFEYRSGSEVHNTKIRRGKGDMPWMESGKPLIPWNVNCLKGAASERQLIFVEGEPDGLACIQSGFLDVLSVPNGAPSSGNEDGEGRYKYLYKGEKLHPNIDKFSSFVLAVDGDEKGKFLRDALAARLGEHRCLWVEWPEGCKDANDVLRLRGKDELWELLANPKRMFIDEVATIDDIPDPPKETSYHLGFEGAGADLKVPIRFPKSGFITILGPYESGKSTFLRQLMYNMSMAHGWRSAITCFEESAKWRTVNALRKTVIGKSVQYFSDAELVRSDDWIRKNIVFIRKKKRTLMTAARLMNRIEYAIKVYGVDMTIIDPLNEIDHDYTGSKSEYIGGLIMDLKDLADSYRHLIICCVHPPSETMRHNNRRRDKFYTLADAADSGHFGNKSDIGLCFWRPSEENITLMNIDKVKNAELCGKPTGIKFRLNEATERYIVVETGWDCLSTRNNDDDSE
jgi:twinkle protein